MEEQERDLQELFMETGRLMHRYHMMLRSRNEGGYDPGRGQGRILALLKRTPGVSQKEMAWILDLRQQSLGEQLKKLEQNGLITRTPSETDRRAMVVELTEKGRNMEFETDLSDDVFSCLDEEERAALSGYLVRVADRLEELTAEGPVDGAGDAGPSEGAGPREGGRIRGRHGPWGGRQSAGGPPHGEGPGRGRHGPGTGPREGGRGHGPGGPWGHRDTPGRGRHGGSGRGCR